MALNIDPDLIKDERLKMNFSEIKKAVDTILTDVANLKASSGNATGAIDKVGSGPPTEVEADFMLQVYGDTQANSLYMAMEIGADTIWVQFR